MKPTVIVFDLDNTLIHSYSTPTLTVSHPYILTDTQTHTDTLTQHTYIHSLIPLCTHSHTDTHSQRNTLAQKHTYSLTTDFRELSVLAC